MWLGLRDFSANAHPAPAWPAPAQPAHSPPPQAAAAAAAAAADTSLAAKTPAADAAHASTSVGEQQQGIAAGGGTQGLLGPGGAAKRGKMESQGIQGVQLGDLNKIPELERQHFVNRGDGIHSTCHAHG